MTEKTLISFEPATGKELWHGQIGDTGEVVGAARRAWPAWAAQPLANRMELLRRFANEVRKEYNNLAELVARETGKPLWEAHIEVENVIGQVEVSIRAYAERTAQRKLDSALQGTAALRHKPHGVMAIITSYIAPAELPASHIVPALLAGNAVVLKPSEKSPATAELLLKCIDRAGIPSGVVQMLIGGPEEGLALATHSGVNGVMFTGSAQVGITINHTLAANPGKLVMLQLGGNNPMIVWDTPKIADAAVLAIQSAFASAGQRGTSVRRLIVKSGMYAALIDEIKRLTDRIIVGAPFDEPAPFMGPMIDNTAADQLTESFLYLLGHGGKAIRHITRPKDELPFVSPAIIDVTDMAERPDIELFGPMLQIVRVDDFDEAIAEANNTRFGLCAALVGGTPQDYNRFWANIRAGLINWNRSTVQPSQAAPIGGLGFSGNLRPGGYYAADSCAYPVTSVEMEQPRASIGAGFHDA